MSGKVASEALNVAIERGWNKRQSIKKNYRNIDGYVLKNAHPDNPDGQDPIYRPVRVRLGTSF